MRYHRRVRVGGHGSDDRGCRDRSAREGEIAQRRVGLLRSIARRTAVVEVGEAAGHVDEVEQVRLLGDDLVHEAADERLGDPGARSG